MEASASKRVRVRASRSFNSHRVGDEFEMAAGPESDRLIENGLLEVVEVIDLGVPVDDPFEDEEDAVESDEHQEEEEE